MVPEPYNLHPNGRNFAIWRAVRGALLPDERHLVEAVLLPVWIPVFGLYHPYYFRLDHQHRDGILPAMRRSKKSILISKVEMIGRLFGHAVDRLIDCFIVWLIIGVINWLIDWLIDVNVYVLSKCFRIVWMIIWTRRNVFWYLQNYRWWWRSLLVSGGVALYVLAYSVFYFMTKLEISGFIPTLLYFGYTLLMVITVWILTGTIGFYAAYFFISRIYGAVKIDWLIGWLIDRLIGWLIDW